MRSVSVDSAAPAGCSLGDDVSDSLFHSRASRQCGASHHGARLCRTRLHWIRLTVYVLAGESSPARHQSAHTPQVPKKSGWLSPNRGLILETQTSSIEMQARKPKYELIWKAPGVLALLRRPPYQKRPSLSVPVAKAYFTHTLRMTIGLSHSFR